MEGLCIGCQSYDCYCDEEEPTMKQRCQGCGDLIPPERIELLPGCVHCVSCSKERAKTVLDVAVDGADPRELERAVQHPDRG